MAPAVTYVVVWHWRSDRAGTPVKMSETRATTALRALESVRQTLRARHANVAQEMVVLEIVREDRIQVVPRGNKKREEVR